MPAHPVKSFRTTRRSQQTDGLTIMKMRSARILERKVKTLMKDIYYFPVDVLDVLSGRRDEMTPPRRLIFVGDGDFRKTGNEFFKYFLDFAGLVSSSKVLDIGCGIGRMAIPLTNYLTSGTYEGIDIVPRGIKWCEKNISSRYPNFHFQLADVYNMWYNPSGICVPSEYRFPFADQSFDFVFLTSVFTHMLPAELENYLAEIARVLKPQGRLLATYFLINEESERLILQSRSTLDFRYSGPGYLTISEGKPEAAVGYREEYIRGLYNKRGLELTGPIHYGSWCGRENFVSYQDMIITVKK